jgi:hypothetical protein
MNEPDWSGSEDDHAFRSHVIQWLLHQPSSPRSGPEAGGWVVPRVVVQYWHDLGALPGDVRACMNSWRPLERRGFERRLFDDARARCFIAENYPSAYVHSFDRCYHPAMRCDYFRLCYILKCGGFYVDADEVYQGADCEALFQDHTIKVQPLCYDTQTEQMVAPEEFLRDVRSPSHRIFYVNNNPIIAPPGHELVRLALRRSTRILRQLAETPDIQSTTGPGNLSAVLVRHTIDLRQIGCAWDFTLLRDWNTISTCQWALSYRNDERNWRLLKVVR